MSDLQYSTSRRAGGYQHIPWAGCNIINWILARVYARMGASTTVRVPRQRFLKI